MDAKTKHPFFVCYIIMTQLSATIQLKEKGVLL